MWEEDECVINAWHSSSRKVGKGDLCMFIPSFLKYVIFQFLIFLQLRCSSWLCVCMYIQYIFLTHIYPLPTKYVVKLLVHLTLKTCFSKGIQYINVEWSQFFIVSPVKIKQQMFLLQKVYYFGDYPFFFHSFKKLY